MKLYGTFLLAAGLRCSLLGALCGILAVLTSAYTSGPVVYPASGSTYIAFGPTVTNGDSLWSGLANFYQSEMIDPTWIADFAPYANTNCWTNSVMVGDVVSNTAFGMVDDESELMNTNALDQFGEPWNYSEQWNSCLSSALSSPSNVYAIGIDIMPMVYPLDTGLKVVTNSVSGGKVWAYLVAFVPGAPLDNWTGLHAVEIQQGLTCALFGSDAEPWLPYADGLGGSGFSFTVTNAGSVFDMSKIKLQVVWIDDNGNSYLDPPFYFSSGDYGVECVLSGGPQIVYLPSGYGAYRVCQFTNY